MLYRGIHNSVIKGSGLFFPAYDRPMIRNINPIWTKMRVYAKSRPENKGTQINIVEADIHDLKFTHAFGPARLQNFSSMEAYMIREAIPTGVSILEGSGGLGGKKTALYAHIIGPDNYKYSDLFLLIHSFFYPTRGKPATVFLPKNNKLPSTIQPGVYAREATWSIAHDSNETHVPINPIIWHDGAYPPKFTVHSPKLFAAWSKDLFYGLDSAKKGVLEVAEWLGLETAEKDTVELLDDIRIAIFKTIKSTSDNDDSSLNKTEKFIYTNTCETLMSVCDVLSRIKEIAEHDKAVRLALPHNISNIIDQYQGQLKPREASIQPLPPRL